MLYMAIITTACSLPIIFLLKEKPLTTPSLDGEVQKIHFKESFGILLKNKDYLLLCLNFSSIFGIL